MVVMVALCATSCVWDEGEVASGRKLGAHLWSISKNDLIRLNEIFDYIARYNQSLSIEDEASRQLFIARYIKCESISVNGNTHTIKHTTNIFK